MHKIGDLRILVFDDDRARLWQPFRLTRPVGDLRFGCMTLAARIGGAIGNRVQGYLGCDDLVGYEDEDDLLRPAGHPAPSPRIQPGKWYPLGEREPSQITVLASSRTVFGRSVGKLLRERCESWPDPWKPADTRLITLVVSGRAVGWLVPPLHELPPVEHLSDPASAPTGEVLELPGTVLEWPWNLVEANAKQIAADVPMLHPSKRSDPSRFRIVGDREVFVHEEAHVEDGVILDAREGPIRIERGVYVQAPARLSGPLHIDQRTQIFGGSIGHSSIGPVCKVRGEIDSSVLCGFVNKAHDGYLGHALLGRWVNLGALTTNSDLKNNYSSVRVHVNGEDIDTGLMKVGCLLGDHVKTGIGTLITTGAVVGAGSNVFGGGITPRSVPPFSWGTGSELVEHAVEKFLATTEVAMARRDIELTGDLADLYRRAFAQTRAERGA